MNKEAKLYIENNGYVECTACSRRCKLKDGQIGFCGVRKNSGGKLYLINYGILSTIHIDPVEKKPAIHFYPGHNILSIGTTGCNWACAYCQNFEISQRKIIEGEYFSPKEIVEIAKDKDVIGIAYTYNEPTIFIEYAHDVGVLAKKAGLKNYFVTNGYMTNESIDYALTFLDGLTVDLKGHGEIGFLRRYTTASDNSPIFNTIERFYKAGRYVEVTDLVVPKIGDNENALREMLERIGKISKDIPIHFLRFFPEYKLSNLEPTPIETLERAHDIAIEMGFKYVYIGNVPGHKYENTYCPNCGNIVIKRFGFEIEEVNLDEENRCKFCGYKLPIVGTPKVNKGFIYSVYN